MDYAAAFVKLEMINQTHILQFFHELDFSQQKELLSQIDKLDLDTFKQQQDIIFQKNPIPKDNIQPIKKSIKVSDITDLSLANEMLSKGQVGCLIVAGGQGSRLQFNGPKGMFLVSPVCKKSLFQIFAEKVVAAGKRANKILPLAIMTSKENEAQIKDFFKMHDFFGLLKEQVSFFSQANMVVLDKTGNLFLENKYTIAKGPDGNGNSLKTFFTCGIFDEWLAKGVRCINYLLIDNPLADPFDLKMLSLQSQKNADVVIKCIKREDPKESVGVLVEISGVPHVVEYSEMNETEKFKKEPSGNLVHSLANISQFSFSMEFIKKIQEKNLPLHKALKAVSYLDSDGKTKQSGDKNAYKFETFIFDVLPFANKVEIMEDLRKNCFSPLKELSGLQNLQETLQTLDYEKLSEITGVKSDCLKPFEIAQDFYYPTETLISKWRGKKIPDQHYIKPDMDENL